MLKTILLAILLFYMPPKIVAQNTKKYSIDHGPIRDPLSRKIARMRYNHDKKRKERLAEKIKEKQNDQFEKVRKASIKKHLANQTPALRKQLEQEMNEGSLPNQAGKKQKKISRIKKKRVRHG